MCVLNRSIARHTGVAHPQATQVPYVEDGERALNLPMPIRFTLALVFALSLSACTTLHGLHCKGGEQLAIQDSVYFGTGKPNGVVTTEEWADFLRTEVTPRFPQGLTVHEASGQWRGADGAIVREATHVLQLVHPNDERIDKQVTEIVASYKTKFQQEAVLRVRAGTCVSF
jgi:hypothetical protein